MTIKRKKDEAEKEEARELVTDMETVKNAIQTCLDFEKEKGIRLIHPKGRRIFSEMYRRDEPKRKIEQIVDSRIDQQLTPLNKKIDILLKLVKSEDDEETTKKKKDTDELKKKIDNL